jgi:hypothetical protein
LAISVGGEFSLIKLLELKIEEQLPPEPEELLGLFLLPNFLGKKLSMTMFLAAFAKLELAIAEVPVVDSGYW